jgi:hypothetical protein
MRPARPDARRMRAPSCGRGGGGRREDDEGDGGVGIGG